MHTGRVEPGRWGTGERVSAVVVAGAVGLLLLAAFSYGAGDDVAFLPLIGALAIGVTGIGAHVAAREARFRREESAGDRPD